MAATVSHIAPDRTRLTRALKHYINEEFGHEEWILNDLQAAGADVRPVLDSGADMATEVMVAYVRDYITTVHPVGFFGMVHVLEGTSTELASNMADLIQHHLHLPDAAFTYLRSHGELDIGHVSLFQELLDDLNDAEMAHVIHVAAIVYPLYRNVLDSIPRVSDSSAA
jgi:pyrroloquinoline quinone (PQQ) biosynthesis protein C